MTAGIKKDILLGKSLAELREVVIELGLPPFTAKQLAEWLYKRQVRSIDDMTNLSLKARELLKSRFDIGLSLPVEVQESADGTKKYLFSVGEHFIESVMIPDDDRATLCVSSQVGCKMGCKFCMTARQGFQANLTAAEILNQLQSIPESAKLTNVVYMGMGEPCDNIDEVLKSLAVATADWGYAWSPKRITVSTIGVIPGMRRFLDESKCHLAVSMHNPFDDERNVLMPMQKAYPLSEAVELLKQYNFTHQRRVSFEYIMFAGYNDTLRHAEQIARLVRGIECRMNLIRFHPIPDSDLQTSDEATLLAFQRYLMDRGITTTIRASRGMDILAACGMLSTKKQGEAKK